LERGTSNEVGKKTRGGYRGKTRRNWGNQGGTAVGWDQVFTGKEMPGGSQKGKQKSGKVGKKKLGWKLAGEKINDRRTKKSGTGR